MDKADVANSYILRFEEVEPEWHVQYVQGYTQILANCYAKLNTKARMSKDKISYIVKAAKLHDVGKLAVPDWVLLKKGRLSAGELEILQTHTLKGAEMIQVLAMTEDAAYNRILRNVVLYHHEKYDGSGYPFGLKKDKIPVEAQIVGLADMYDTLLHPRSDRKYFTKEEAYQMLLNGEFGEISPRMSECLKFCKEELEALEIAMEE